MVDTFVARRGSPVAAAHSGQAPKQPSPRQRRIQKNKERHLVKQQERRQQQDQAPLPETAAAAAAPPQPPPGRPALGCPHFASCSGCTLEQDLDRPQLLEEAHAFFAEQCAFSGFRLTAGSVHGWRRRARLAVRRSSSGGQAEIGLFEEGSHTVVPIPSCV